MFDPNTISIIISGLVSFALGGGMVAYLKFFQEKKTSDLSFIEKDREEMKQEIESLKQQISAINAQIITLTFKIVIKNHTEVYLFVHQSRAIQNGAPIRKFQSDVIGKTDAQVFADYPEFAKTMQAIHREAEKSGGLAIREKVVFPNGIGIKNVIKEIAVKESENVMVFRGYAIPAARAV